MIQITVDGIIRYDSRLSDYDLLTLSFTAGLNKGGCATITMPPGHPAYNAFVSFSSIVEIYRDSILLFRGRPLYPTDDFIRRRTITCEGELCFFRDGLFRPGTYTGTPVQLLGSILSAYNAQAAAAKQFVQGTVTVTGAQTALVIEEPEQISDALNRLLERFGGYFVFTTNGSDARCLNWYTNLAYQSTQEIRFGENLLDHTRSANTEIATRIVPYGAKDASTGQRLTIVSVNSGLDYVEDTDAVALRGVICKPLICDDITDAATLKSRAQSELAKTKNIVTTLSISAVDLASAGQNFDLFRVGDRIHVISDPHGIDGWMLLEELTTDLLNPAASAISLGMAASSLTGADVARDRASQTAQEQLAKAIRSDYGRAIAAAQTTLTSLIEQTATYIQSTVAATYATQDGLQNLIFSQITQLSNAVTLQFTQLREIVDANDAESRSQWIEMHSYVHIEDGDVILGKDGNAIRLRLENDVIGFYDGDTRVAYFTDRKLYVTDGEFLSTLKLGKFAFTPRANGNLSFRKVVE